MGMFTWRLLDTQEPLRLGDVAYLLRPGASPLSTGSYDGYGTFGGWDAHSLLGWTNFGPEAARRDPDAEGLQQWLDLSNDARESYRHLGIHIESRGSLCCDVHTGTLYAFQPSGLEYVSGIEPQPFTGNYGTPEAAYGGLTPNDLLAEGNWVATALDEVVDVPYPLRITREPAPYEAFEGSAEHISNQVLFEAAEEHLAPNL